MNHGHGTEGLGRESVDLAVDEVYIGQQFFQGHFEVRRAGSLA